MLHRFLTLSSVATLLLALTAPTAVAQSQKLVPLSTNELKCFTSGSGETYWKVCLSRTGNIVKFESPAGKQHLYQEGYALCYRPNDIRLPIRVAYDAATSESGWNDPQITYPGAQGSLPVVITRTTTDGLVKLKQTISRDTAENDITISMDVTNLTGQTLINVKLDRYFDGDIDGTAGGDFYDRTSRPGSANLALAGNSVTAREANGLMLTGLTDYPFTAIHPYASWEPASCGQASVIPNGAGDFVGRVSVPIQLPARRTENVKFLYRAY